MTLFVIFSLVKLYFKKLKHFKKIQKMLNFFTVYILVFQIVFNRKGFTEYTFYLLKATRSFQFSVINKKVHLYSCAIIDSPIYAYSLIPVEPPTR